MLPSATTNNVREGYMPPIQRNEVHASYTTSPPTKCSSSGGGGGRRKSKSRSASKETWLTIISDPKLLRPKTLR
nr:hypothetical protein [Tanacetum cinerariifolium]